MTRRDERIAYAVFVLGFVVGLIAGTWDEAMAQSDSSR